MGFKTKKAAQTTELTCHKRVVGGWRGQRDIAEGECLGVSSKQTAESESLTKAMLWGAWLISGKSLSF